MDFLIKIFFSAFLIALASEIAKRNSFLAALIIALPLTSVFSLIWLWRETADVSRVSALSMSVFWLVLPTLPFFVLLPQLLRLQWNFYAALFASLSFSIASSLLLMQVLKRFGVQL
jgi:hypothetical protein